MREEALLIGPKPMMEHVETYLLLAHCSPRLLRYSCGDLAAAAILSSLHLDGRAAAGSGGGCGAGGRALHPLLLTEEAQACAVRMLAIRSQLCEPTPHSFAAAATTTACDAA